MLKLRYKGPASNIWAPVVLPKASGWPRCPRSDQATGQPNDTSTKLQDGRFRPIPHIAQCHLHVYFSLGDIKASLIQLKYKNIK
uniref:Uncharacterized protein n=1 Tax=Anguilla anguilla TaxID=7936 RepID=A0A0E9WIV6_ANGAN